MMKRRLQASGRRCGLFSVNRLVSWSRSGLVAMAAAVGLAALPGCGDDNSVGSLTVYPVKGKVLLADGKPLSGGRVVLVPTGEAAAAISPNGTISPDGEFTIQAGSAGEGAPEGQYKVRIEADGASLPAATGSKSSRRASQFPFPLQYTDEDSSGLAVAVKPGVNQLEPFTLAKGGPAKGRDNARKNN
jgi:hypothetical protein